MQRKTLTENEVKSFKILRTRIFTPFQKSLDLIIKKYPEAWRKKSARKRLERAFINYFKHFFGNDKSNLTSEQVRYMKYRDAGFF